MAPPITKSRRFGMDQAKRDISRILTLPLKYIGLTHLLNYSVI